VVVYINHKAQILRLLSKRFPDEECGSDLVKDEGLSEDEEALEESSLSLSLSLSRIFSWFWAGRPEVENCL